MGDEEPARLRPRLSLIAQILLVGAVTLALILGWAGLNASARAELDELLAHQVRLESQEEKLNRLGRRLCVVKPGECTMSDAVAYMTGAKLPEGAAEAA